MRQLLSSMPGSFEWLVILLGIAFVIYWIKCIVEIAGSQFNDDSNRILWLLLVIFAPLIGLLLYRLIGRKSRVTG
jgi:hypothetical protein